MASIWGELKRRKVVKVAAAYAIVGWLLIEVASVPLPTFQSPEWVMRVFSFAIIAGFPLAIVLAWAFDITPEGIKVTPDAPPSESTTQSAGHKLKLESLRTVVDRIENNEPDQAYFLLMIVKSNAQADPVLDEPRFRELRSRIGTL